MFVLIGLAIDMAIVSVLSLPVLLLWSYYIKVRKPSKGVVSLGASMFAAFYVIILICLFFWQCNAEDDEMRSHITPRNPGKVELIL